MAGNDLLKRRDKDMAGEPILCAVPHHLQNHV